MTGSQGPTGASAPPTERQVYFKFSGTLTFGEPLPKTFADDDVSENSGEVIEYPVGEPFTVTRLCVLISGDPETVTFFVLKNGIPEPSTAVVFVAENGAKCTAFAPISFTTGDTFGLIATGATEEVTLVMHATIS